MIPLVITNAVPSAHLDAGLVLGPAHLRPIVSAVRHHGVAWLTVPQHAGAFDLPPDRPGILVLGDDLHEALGPGAFHSESIRRAVARCAFAAIVACEALPEVYATAAEVAAFGRLNAVVVETRPEWEGEWLALLSGINPALAITLATVLPEGRA